MLGALVGELLAGRSDGVLDAGTALTTSMLLVRVFVWGLVSVPFAIATRRVLTGGHPRAHRAAMLAAAVVLMMTGHVLAIAAIGYVPPRAAPVLGSRAFSIDFVRALARNDALVAVLIALTVYALEYERVGRMAREREGELQMLATQAQLEMLRMQLQPHFLFNSLNAIAALIDVEPRAAQRMIDQLGGFLRQTLVMAPHAEVPLRDELALVSQYLDIERIRFGGRLRVSVEVADGVSDALVPALLLQPLVENAVRHGIQPSIPGGTLSVRAHASARALHIEVADDGVGLTSSPVDPAAGIGLRNSRERLRHSYGADASLVLEPRTGGGTLATVSLPLRRGVPATPR